MKITDLPLDTQSLIQKAIDAQSKAYAPYSHYSVGSAILTSNGKIYTGCNVENASYGATICAERTASLKAVSEGEQKFQAVVVVTESSPPAFPCGLCKQVLSEFCLPTTEFYICNKNNEVITAHAKEFFSFQFKKESLIK